MMLGKPILWNLGLLRARFLLHQVNLTSRLTIDQSQARIPWLTWWLTNLVQKRQDLSDIARVNGLPTDHSLLTWGFPSVITKPCVGLCLGVDNTFFIHSIIPQY